jgi:electron transfer flavoprotein alpha subunit
VAVLVLVEQAGGELAEPSAQALTLARGLAADVVGVAVGNGDGLAEAVGRHGVATLHVAEIEGSYAPAAWAAAIVELAGRIAPSAIAAAGSETGNEVLAHVAARLDLPFAANCIEAGTGDGVRVTRTRWGGSLLEEATVHGEPAILSVQPHALAAVEIATGAAAVETFTPALAESDVAARIVEHVAPPSGGISLSDAKVVVSGGRGVGSAEGFAIVEELAGLLAGAVGCSRVVTSAGWRPHTDQVGQTGTKISPELYIPCGISGATQHIAGCRGAKRILAVNADPEAPIFASADYAVIGDLHEILPAISAEIRKVRGT